MHLNQDIKPISYLKAKAVVQNIKSYKNLQNSSNLLKIIVQSEDDIEKNNVIEQDKMFDTLEQKLFG